MKHRFTFIWISQTTVIFSVLLNAFAASILVYRESGSLAQLSIVMLLAFLPEVLITPFCGNIVDRFNRKRILALCSLAQSIIFAFYFYFLIQNASEFSYLHVGETYLTVALSSAIAGLHRLTYTSSISLIATSPKAYPRLNGIAQAGSASAQILAPFIAGSFLEFTYQWSFALCASALCFASFVALASVSIPDTKYTRNTFKDAIREGFNTIRANRGLKSFLALHAFANFSRGAAIVLFTPLVLNLAGEATLGSLRSMAGAGIAVGALLVTTINSRNHLQNIFYLLAFSGLAIALTGLTKSLVVIGVAAFVLCLITPIIGALAQSVWQIHIPNNLQGRVFGIRDSIANTALAAGYFCGPWSTWAIESIPGTTHMSSISWTYLTLGALTVAVALSTRSNTAINQLNHYEEV
ncbi:MFS transporter [Agarilytica rhodophyticola]|uniref:MFS transporter n=1 Tax=Agarilytica rhodophyticola TaxID=1737490 RepID=UPI000CD910CE|nr:MFS transporter [Agarilytica rhodophyticola]